MKFSFLIQRTSLHMAVLHKNDEIIKLLLNNPKIDVNIKQIKIILLNRMQN